MAKHSKKLNYQTIPSKLSEKDFNQFVLPFLSRGTRGPQPKISLYKCFSYIMFLLYSGCQWKSIPIEKDKSETPEIHYTSIFKRFKVWVNDGSMKKVFTNSVVELNRNDLIEGDILHGDGTTTVAKKGGDNRGYSGHKHLTGEKIVAIVDRACNVIAPFTTAPGNRNECILLPNALEHLSSIAKLINLPLQGVVMSLDSAYDSIKNRKMIFNKDMIPNIKENKRNRKKTKRGPKRIYDEQIYQERFRTVERTFAWEDKFKRLLMRFERISENHLGLKLIAYTMINLRHFCNS